MALSNYDIRFILSVSDRTGNSLRRVASDMRQAGTDAARMKKAFAAMDIGRGLQLRGLLAGAGLGAAAQQAANFATSVTKAASQIAGNNSVEKIGQNTVKLQTQILDLMKQFPATAQEQADAAYDIFSSMNVPLKQGVALLKLFNMVAVAGATDLSTATNAMITILNNFGGSWKQTMKAVNTSFAIIRFGRLEFSEFNEMLNAVVPAAKQAGQSLDDVSGAMALVTKLIPSQKQGATAISRLLEVLSRPDFRAGAKKMGLSIEDATGSLKPLPQIIGELARLDISKAQSTINSLFSVVTSVGRGGGRGIQSTVQARRALVLLVKEYQQYVATQRNVTGATSEFEKRYTAMIGSAGVKWEKFKAQLQALLIMIGAAVIPAFERLGEIITRGVDWAQNNRGTIEFIAKTTLAIAVTSLLAGTFLKLYGSALIVFTGLKRLGAMTGGFLAIWGRFAAAIDAVPAALLRAYSAMFFVSRGSGGLAVMLANATRAMWLFITAVSTLNITGAKAALGLVPLMGMLGRLAKIGVITIGINVLLNLFKKEPRERAGFLAKHGLLGSAALELIFGTDFGTAKWFQSKEIKDAIDKFDKKQKAARKGPMDKMGKGLTSDFQKLIKQIRRDIKSQGGQLFDAKMMKDLGIDPATINKQVQDLINPTAGQSNSRQAAAQFAKDVTQRTKELLDQASDKLVEIYQGFKDANKSAFGELFQGPLATGEEAELRKQWNWTDTADNILNDLRAQIRQFREWRSTLKELIARGAPAEMVKEIQAQGPEAMKKVNELLGKNAKRKPAFILAGEHEGLVQTGNIDIMNRKVVKLGKDIATVRSITVGTGKGFTVLPTIINGKAVSNQQAIAYYKKTGKNLGTFASEAQANAYARSLHTQQGKLYKGTDTMLDTFIGLWKTKNRLINQATETDFKQQVDKWNKFGKDTAFKIITGMESEEQGVQKRMNNMVSRLYTGVAQTIAQQQVKLEQAASQLEIPIPKFGVSPKTGATKNATPIPASDIKAAGLGGKFAIPSSSIGDLSLAAVRAMGLRGQAMARAYAPIMGGQTQITNFNVDGTFLTPAEMMDAAMRQASHKVKHKR